MASNRIVFADGRQLPLATLADHVSASLFQTDLHYDVCEAVARMAVQEPGVVAVLHNLLALKSRVLMGVTALLSDADIDRSAISHVALTPEIGQAVGGRLTTAGLAVQIVDAPEALVPRSVAVAFAMKVLMHRLYRLISKPLSPGVPVVRAWVEVTEVMYADLFPVAQIRLYPFSYGLGRQLAFARSLARRRFNWSFDGVPYRWRDLLVALASARRRHVALARAECRAYTCFGDALLRAGVREVYSSDEYEVGAVAAGERLRAGGAAYVNTAHGIGLYSPKVAYTRFDYLNRYQADFYGRSSPGMELRKRRTANSRLPFERVELEAGDSVAIVYVHQNFEAYQLPSEIAAQERIMRALADAAAALDVAAVVKLHPNMPQERFKAQLPPRLRVAARWDELRGTRPVFLTIYSTAYYELAPVAPVLVYSAPTYNPGVYLDGQFQTFTDQDLVQNVARLLDRDCWRALVERQARSLGATE